MVFSPEILVIEDSQLIGSIMALFSIIETLILVIFELIFAMKPPKFLKNLKISLKKKKFVKPWMVSMKSIKWFQGFQKNDLFSKIY